MNSFDKTRRLLKKSQYDFVFSQAKKTSMPEFILLHRQNKEGQARLGLALSKKMISKSHDRNRVKRLLRESFRTTQLPAIDVVILAKTGVGKHENKIITESIVKAWDLLNNFYAK